MHELRLTDVKTDDVLLANQKELFSLLLEQPELISLAQQL